MANHPKVFMSYSYDTPEHKQLVSELATKLHRKGVNVHIRSMGTPSGR